MQATPERVSAATSTGLSLAVPTPTAGGTRSLATPGGAESTQQARQNLSLSELNKEILRVKAGMEHCDKMTPKAPGYADWHLPGLYKEEKEKLAKALAQLLADRKARFPTAGPEPELPVKGGFAAPAVSNAESARIAAVQTSASSGDDAPKAKQHLSLSELDKEILKVKAEIKDCDAKTPKSVGYADWHLPGFYAEKKRQWTEVLGQLLADRKARFPEAGPVPELTALSSPAGGAGGAVAPQADSSTPRSPFAAAIGAAASLVNKLVFGSSIETERRRKEIADTEGLIAERKAMIGSLQSYLKTLGSGPQDLEQLDFTQVSLDARKRELAEAQTRLQALRGSAASASQSKEDVTSQSEAISGTAAP
ncbi:MAG: hypothetical protein K0Q57_921 [Gammaproteobacteria bacterium]|jgi:hypothetical protein|nr:hypothetical protein [Gammaproteobacteria bacterium]